MPESQIIEIVEVVGPAEQGLTLPFRCRGEDGHLYYVKGQQTNRASLWHEWICGHLAMAFGLPVPAFSLVRVDEILLEALPPEWRCIGSLPAFGSRQHPGSSWLELAMAKQVPTKVQTDVLIFDWWVHNADRTLGNPNLLWDPHQEELVVIDHNLAFDREFEEQGFLQVHVFGSQWHVVSGDLVARAEYQRRMTEAVSAAIKAHDTAPECWLWENSEFDVPARFDWPATLALLERCATPELWRTV